MSNPMKYETLIKVAASCLNPEVEYEVNAQHGLTDEFYITVPARDGGLIHFQVNHKKDELELIVPLKTFPAPAFEKWHQSLEYELEQVFMRNVRLEIVDTVQEYRIKVLI